MKYRIQADVSFNNEDDAIAFKNMIEEVKGRISDMDRSVKYHECNHDEANPSPCVAEHLDMTGAKIEHKNKAGKKIVFDTAFLTKEDIK